MYLVHHRLLREGGFSIIQIGQFQKLKIANLTSFGAYLDAETGSRTDNVLLPGKEVPSDAREGTLMEVFVYRDSEDRPIATTRRPLASAGELAYLKVAAKTPIGAFMDIGLERGLFLPFSEQKFTLEIGRSYLVYVYLDRSGRLSCTTDIYEHLTTGAPYQKNDQLSGTVYSIDPEIGVFVAIDDKYKGLIPPNEYFSRYEYGDRVSVRVIRVREDGKLDLSPRMLSHLQMDVDAQTVLQVMLANDGLLPINEKASPQEIEQHFQMSKAAFKRAISALFKAEKIVKAENGWQAINHV